MEKSEILLLIISLALFAFAVGGFLANRMAHLEPPEPKD